VLGLAMVLGLAHFTFCHSSPQKPASPDARNRMASTMGEKPYLATRHLFSPLGKSCRKGYMFYRP